MSFIFQGLLLYCILHIPGLSSRCVYDILHVLFSTFPTLFFYITFGHICSSFLCLTSPCFRFLKTESLIILWLLSFETLSHLFCYFYMLCHFDKIWLVDPSLITSITFYTYLLLLLSVFMTLVCSILYNFCHQYIFVSHCLQESSFPEPISV